jgi:glycosyltransferase involved in cell wall biosynthesis
MKNPMRAKGKKSVGSPIKLRIAHVTPTYFSPGSVVGGGERYVFNLAQALQAAGAMEQCVLALGPEDALFEQGGVPIRVMRNESKWSGATDAYSSKMRVELEGFDIIHIHQCLTTFGAYTTAILRDLDIPLIGTDLGGGENTLMMKGGGLRLLSGMLSISKFARDLVAPYFGGPHQVLIGPVDSEYFSPNNIKREKDHVICVGRILPHKGLDTVVSALPSSLRLTIAGRIYDEDYYKLLTKMAIGKSVTFVTDAGDADLLQLYRTATVLVQASTSIDIYGRFVAKSELMGLAALEALSCGLPVILARTGSLPELVPEGTCGRVFSTIEELRDLLKDVDGGKWPPIGASEAARTAVLDRHSTDVIGRQLLEFYDIVSRGGLSS